MDEANLKRANLLWIDLGCRLWRCDSQHGAVRRGRGKRQRDHQAFVEAVLVDRDLESLRGGGQVLHVARGERGARQCPPEAGVAGPQLGVAAELLARERDARLDARGRLSRLRERDPYAVPSEAARTASASKERRMTADRIEPPEDCRDCLVRIHSNEVRDERFSHFGGSAELGVVARNRWP